MKYLGPFFPSRSKNFDQKIFRDSRGNSVEQETKDGPHPNIQFYLKDFYTTQQISFLFKEVIDKSVLPHENDGLIFTRNSYPYIPGKCRGILKWKP
jgi:mRNA capping enzyme, catalytic domain